MVGCAPDGVRIGQPVEVAFHDTILGVPQPIVAAVHGHAMGLGATIALFCDVVVAAEDARFADPTSAWRSWPATAGR